MNDVVRDQRRARTAADAAFAALETARVLERPDAAVEAGAAIDKAWSRPALTDDDRRALTARRAELDAALRNHDASDVRAYATKYGLGGARMWTSSQGARFFRVITESFPRHVNYVYVVEVPSEMAYT